MLVAMLTKDLQQLKPYCVKYVPGESSKMYTLIETYFLCNSSMKNILLLVFVFVFDKFQSMEKSEFKSVWKQSMNSCIQKLFLAINLNSFLRNPDEELMNLLKKISEQHRGGKCMI